MPFPAAPSTRASRSKQALINTKVGSTGMGGVGAVQIIITMLRRVPIPTDTILAVRTFHKCATIRAYTLKAHLPTVLAVLIRIALSDTLMTRAHFHFLADLGGKVTSHIKVVLYLFIQARFTLPYKVLPLTFACHSTEQWWWDVNVGSFSAFFLGWPVYALLCPVLGFCWAHRKVSDWGRLTHSTMAFLTLFTIFVVPAFYFWWRWRWRWRQYTITIHTNSWRWAVLHRAGINTLALLACLPWCTVFVFSADTDTPPAWSYTLNISTVIHILIIGT